MTDNDHNLPQENSSSWDIFGLGAVAKQLIGPITLGVGKALGPKQRRREDRAERENFDDWDKALKRKGYQPKTVELSLGQRTEVRVLAEQIGHQRNRENIAWESIEHARYDVLPADPSLSEPSRDWLERFWRLAENINDSEMQAFWGLVLARRATRKAGFSTRALELLSTLTADEARDLERLARCVVTSNVDGFSNAGLVRFIGTYLQPISEAQKSEVESLAPALASILNPVRADLFGPLGLYLQSGFAHDIAMKPQEGIVTFQVAEQSFRCRVEAKFLDRDGLFILGTGTGISPLGAEIFGVLKSEADEDYVEILRRGFELKGLKLERTN